MILSTYSKLIYEKLPVILVIKISYNTLKEIWEEAIIAKINPVFQKRIPLLT